MQPSGVHATSAGAFLDQQSDVDGMKPVDVLRRIDRVEHALLRVRAHPFRQRRLHEDAVDAIVVIEPAHERERLG